MSLFLSLFFIREVYFFAYWNFPLLWNILLHLNTSISSTQRRIAGSQESRLLTLLRSRKNTSSLFLHGRWRSIFFAQPRILRVLSNPRVHRILPLYTGVGYTTLGTMSMYRRALSSRSRPRLRKYGSSKQCFTRGCLESGVDQKGAKDPGGGHCGLRIMPRARWQLRSYLRDDRLAQWLKLSIHGKIPFDWIISMEIECEDLINAISENQDK